MSNTERARALQNLLNLAEIAEARGVEAAEAAVVNQYTQDGLARGSMRWFELADRLREQAQFVRAMTPLSAEEAF